MTTRQNGLLPSVVLLLLPWLSHAAGNIDCKNVVVGDNTYDLWELRGAHSVHWVYSDPPSTKNTTFTLDLCNPLQRDTDDVAFKECATGSRVCGVDYVYRDGKLATIDSIKAIAGNYVSSTGRGLDANWESLNGSDSHGDAEKDGLRLIMNGGRHPFNRKDGQDQQAIIEFICDKNRDEDERPNVDEHFKSEKKSKRDTEDEDEDDDQDDGNGENEGEGDDLVGDEPNNSLQFVKYSTEVRDKKTMGVLRLEWKTKWVCANQEKLPSKKTDGSWGFFTWFIIILFLAIAAYLIFGSWLNYNRYGARGWDLLPHGDTIRDLPYLLKDWARRVLGAFQGSGSRGGYSAV